MAAENTSTLAEMPHRLLLLVTEVEEAAAACDVEHWHAARGEGKWTRLQVLGHLIDSAANNHQRFVRALAQPSLEFPGYDQVAHVWVQNYAGTDAAVCLALWAAYNRHLSHVIGQIGAAKASTLCSIGAAPAMPLSDLVLDYVAHLEHHMKQIFEGHPIRYSGMPWPPADANRQWPA